MQRFFFNDINLISITFRALILQKRHILDIQYNPLSKHIILRYQKKRKNKGILAVLRQFFDTDFLTHFKQLFFFYCFNVHVNRIALNKAFLRRYCFILLIFGDPISSVNSFLCQKCHILNIKFYL